MIQPKVKRKFKEAKDAVSFTSLVCNQIRGHPDNQCEGQAAGSLTAAEEGDRLEVDPVVSLPAAEAHEMEVERTKS